MFSAFMARAKIIIILVKRQDFSIEYQVSGFLKADMTM